MLVDADLRGLLVGMTLQTKPAEIYRALIEATAFGTRVIVDAFESGGVAVDSIVACGGLPERNKLLMQIYADVLGREIEVGASTQAPALGAAMFGAVAAGEYDSIADAAPHMARPSTESFTPSADAHARLRRSSTASTSACTISSAAAATRSCEPQAPARRGGLQVEVPDPAVAPQVAQQIIGEAARFARGDIPLDVLY